MYLTEKMLEYNKESSKLILVCAVGSDKSNSNLQFLDTNHEEEDTLIIHQAVLATFRCPPSLHLTFFSTDTDVLVLLIANYDKLVKYNGITACSSTANLE